MIFLKEMHFPESFSSTNLTNQREGGGDLASKGNYTFCGTLISFRTCSEFWIGECSSGDHEANTMKLNVKTKGFWIPTPQLLVI
jgi:hypothetical protein